MSPQVPGFEPGRRTRESSDGGKVLYGCYVMSPQVLGYEPGGPRL